MEVPLEQYEYCFPQLVSIPTISTVPSTVRTESFDVEAPSIRHCKSKKKDTTPTSPFFGLSRPVLAMFSTLLLPTTGGAAFLFKEWLQIPGLRIQIQELQSQLDRLAQLNQELDSSNARLNQTTNQLASENDRFTLLNVELQRSNLQLNQTTQLLQGQVQNLTLENERFMQSNTDLRDVASFLNATASGLDESFEGMANYRSEQIRVNRQLVVESLHHLCLDRIASWDCHFADYVRSAPWFGDP
jgi:hypothetical protein